ncbi:MAG: GGDEF domain-containing protein [Clostridia bacterium]|nr:GGDEF domain-containing protein [Clostridia bacterium]
MNTEKFYKNMLENISDGIYFVDENRKIGFWNKGAERITGYSSEEMVDKLCYMNILNHVDVHGNELCLNGCPLQATIHDGKERDSFVFLKHKQGHRVPVLVKTIPIKENDMIIGAVEVFKSESENITVTKELEDLKEISLKDQLTGLPNRRYLDNYLLARKNELMYLGVPFGIMFIDIDHFKIFNDTYGHDTGDEVLKMVANVLLNSTRSNDLIGRWGGEEFLGIFSGIDLKSLKLLSEKIRILVEKSSISKDENALHVTISIGATMVDKYEHRAIAVDRADKLLYKSKNEGRNRVTVG